MQAGATSLQAKTQANKTAQALGVNTDDAGYNAALDRETGTGWFGGGGGNGGGQRGSGPTGSGSSGYGSVGAVGDHNGTNRGNNNSKGNGWNGHPVLLDLSGNGLSVDGLGSSSRFVDLAGDGYEYRTAWAGEGNGVLVFDADGDGKISRSSEFIFTEWDKSETSDLRALKKVFDTNGNGKLDAGDARWADFKVMVGDQLVSLASLGITSIDLTPKGSGQSFEDGSAITGTTTYTKSDGTTGQVGDAVLVGDENGYKVKRTKTVNADGSTTEDLLAYNKDGSLAFRNLITTNADGSHKLTKFDDDGNGTFDRSQTVDLAVGGDGTRSRAVANFNADGSLQNKTTTVTSSDKKTVTILVDQDGDGRDDQSQVFVSNADGSTSTTVKQFAVDGSLIKQTQTTSSADGLTKVIKRDETGSGTFNIEVTETTVIAGDGSRTKTVSQKSSNGTLIGRVVTVTSADGRSETIEYDRTGGGTIDQKEVSVTATATDGSVTNTVTSYNRDGSLRNKSTATTSTDGLSHTLTEDLDSDGIADLATSNVAVVAGDGSRSQTVEKRSGNGSLLSKQVTATSADGKTITVVTDANGDGAADQTSSIVVDANGITTSIVSKLNANGSLIGKLRSVSSADGLTQATDEDLDGDATYDRTTTDVTVVNADGSRTQTIQHFGRGGAANGTLVDKTATTISQDSLTKTIASDINGDGVVDRTVVDAIVLNSDGSRTETVTTKSGNGTKLAQTVTTVSADRKISTVTEDLNGDNAIDRSTVTTVNGNGSKVTTVTDIASNGSTIRKSETNITADGLTTTSRSDVNGDGVNDVTNTQSTVINGDGSRTTTSKEWAGTTLVSQGVVSVSGNGLNKTTLTDLDGDLTYDTKEDDFTAFNADGSTTRTITSTAGTGTVASRKRITTSANGLSTKVEVDIDGDGSYDQTTTTVKQLAADGSTTELIDEWSADSTRLSKTTATISGDKKSSTTTVDTDGNGTIDVSKAIVVGNDGTTTTIEKAFSPNGTLISSRQTTVSASGLSTSFKEDWNGDGTYDKTSTSAIVINADGSRTETVSAASANGSLLSGKTTTTISASGLSKTEQVDLTGDGVVDKTTSSIKTFGLDGSETLIVETRAGNTALLGKSISTTTADRKTQTTTYDDNGDGAIDRTVTVALNGNGTTTTTATDTASNGTTIVKKVTEVSADGLTTVVREDLNGDGTFDKVTIDQTTLGADGAKTRRISEQFGSGPSTLVSQSTTSANGYEIVADDYDRGWLENRNTKKTVFNANGTVTTTETNVAGSQAALVNKTTTTVSANGLVTTVAADIDGNGSVDKTSTTTKAVLEDGKTVETVSVINGTSNLIAKTTTSTSGDRKKVTTQYDLDGDGYDDLVKVAAKQANGSTVETIAAYSGTGATWGQNSLSIKTTSADGLTETIETDTNGDEVADRSSRSSIVFNADGSKTQTFTNSGPGGTLKDKTIVTTSANALVVSTQWMADGTSVTRSLEDVTTLNGDGSTVRSLTYKKAGGVLESATVTTTSADKKTITTTFDRDGDGVVDQKSVSVVAGDGSVTTTSFDVPPTPSPVEIAVTGLDRPRITGVWVSQANSNGRYSLTIKSDSFFQDYTIILQDENYSDIASGTFERGDGGSTAIIELPSGYTRHIQIMVTYTMGGDAFAATVAKFEIPSLELLFPPTGRRKIVTTSADGLTVTTDYDTNGDGTVDNRTVEATILNADGSKTTTTTRYSGTTVAVERTIIVLSADGKTQTTSYDLNADGTIEKKQTSSTAFGPRSGYSDAKTETIENAVGTTVKSRFQTSTSANGMSTTKEWDVDGNGTVDQSATETLSITNQGTIRTVSAFNGGTKTSSATTTTSNDGRTVTTVEEFSQSGMLIAGRPDFSNRTTTIKTETLADGATVERKVFTNTSNGVVQKELTRTSADGREITIERDIDGNGTIDQIEQRTKLVDGTTKTVVTGYSSPDKTTITTSFDGLSSSIEWDMDLDGAIDRRRLITTSKNADGSQSSTSTDYKMVAGSADKRVKITSSSVSADARTKSLSIDTDGDGVFDKVTLTLIDASGGSVTTTTNYAEAQKAENIVLGEIYWKQAIAAKVVTTVASDGLTVTEQSDYDGNGTFETTAVSRTQIDGSVRTDYTEVGADGSAVATGTMLTSSDGRTKVFIKINKNRTIDRWEKTETFIDGQIVRTVEEYNPNFSINKKTAESILANGNLSHRYVWDGAGVKTEEYIRQSNGTALQYTYVGTDAVVRSVHLVSKDGKLVSGTFYDPKSTDPWNSIEQTYNADGKKTLEKQFMDDGTRVDISFDVATDKKKQGLTYDASNRLIAQATFVNDILTTNVLYDPTNAKPWSRVEQTYTSDGKKVSLEKQFMDDGMRADITFDTANTQTWKDYSIWYDTAGRIVQVQYNYDDGTRYQDFRDAANASSWSLIVQHFNAAGQQTDSIQTNDNGTSEQTYYDPTNSQSWHVVTYYVDSAGRITNEYIYYDDNTRYYDYRDVNNTQIWSTITQTFNTSGQIVYQRQNNDDGSFSATQFDPANAYSWTNYTAYYNTSGQYYQEVYNYDNGIRSDIWQGALVGQPYKTYQQDSLADGRVTYTKYVNQNGTYITNEYDVSNQYSWTRWEKNYSSNNVLMSDTIYYDNGSVGSSTGPIRPGGPHGPVVLDLDQNGTVDVRTLAPQSAMNGPRFDWDGDGQREHTSWVGAGDAFLAIDLAGDGSSGPDGVIDQAKEVAFNLWGNGDNGVTPNTSDLEALRLVFDTNKDNVFDSNDARWGEFRVWRDANQNGVTDAGELKSLAEAGIARIGLIGGPEGAKQFEDGSEIYGTSWFETVGGSRNLVGDVKLVSTPADPEPAPARAAANDDVTSAPANFRVDSLVAAMASFGADTSAGATELNPDANNGIGTWKQDQLAASSRVWSAA